MPDFDKNLNPILLNEDSNPLNLPNPATRTPNNYANLSETSLSPRTDNASGKSATDRFFGGGPVVSPMLPTVSAKELYDNRRYGKFDRSVIDIEDQNAYAQSGWDKAANGVLKGLNLTATTIAGGFGTLYGVGKFATTGRFADIWDNEALRGIDDWNNEVDQTYLPNYYTEKEKNASWYSPDNWFKANWLFDKLIKNSGYAVGAMISGNIANAGLLRLGSALGRGASALAASSEASQAFKLFTPLLRNTARAFSAGKNIEAAAILEKELSSIADITTRASKLGEIAKQTNAIAKMNDASRRTLISLYSAAGESSFEALQTGNQFRESLIEEYKNSHSGDEPTGEELEKINKASETVGKYSFLGNMALLAATEFTQLPKLLGSSYNSTRQSANSLLGRVDDVVFKDGKYAAVPTSTTRFGKLYDRVTGVGKYIYDPKESLQEIGQYALQVGTQNYFNKAYQSKNADAWVDGFLYGFVGKTEEGDDVGALVSKEGIESGILGGITGGLMQARGTYLEQKATKSNTQTFIDSLDKAPTFKKAFVDRKNAVNRAVVLNEQQQSATVNGDSLEANDLNYDSMHNYLAPRIKYGRYDMVKEDIKELRQELTKPEGIDSLKEQGIAGIEDTRESFLEKLDNFERATDYVNSIYKSLNLRYSGVLKEDGTRKYNPEVIDKMVYAASKIADYDVRIPLENAALVSSGINTLPILESIINEFAPNKASTQEVIQQIDNMTNIISDKRDELKSALTNVIELSMRRKLFMDEYDAIKNKPEEFETPSEFEFGETEELPVSVKQRFTPEGKKKRIIGEKELEVGKVYHLKKPMFKRQGSLVFGPKMAVLSQTLGGEYEVQMPDGTITFMRPEDFVPYDITETTPVTPKLQKILDESIDATLNKKKYSTLNKPTENKLDYINSLKNPELVDDVEKEFEKRSKDYLKQLEEETKKAELMRRYKEQLQKTQDEIAKLSNGIPTGDDESDSAASNVFEDMKKIVQRLFTSTTHASEDWEKGQIPPHITRFIEFTNNVKKLNKKYKLKVMMVTSAQESLFGLDGLSNLSFESLMDKSLIVTKEQYDALSDEKKKEVVLNGFVGAVVVREDNKGNRLFIDKDGNSIGVVGEVDPSTGAPKKIDLNKVVFSTMPSVNLYNSKNQPKYRSEQKDDAVKYVAAWEAYRKLMFDDNPKNFFVFDFGVSKGIPVINKDAPEKNFVGEVLLDDVNRMNNEQFVYVSTKGEVAHDDGNNYRIPAGRPYFKNADDLTYLNNNKFSKKTASTIFAALKEMSSRVSRQIEGGGNVTLNIPELTEYLTNVLFWYSKGGAAVNKLYIDDNNMLHIGRKENGKIVESVYDFANIANYETEVVNDLTNSYYNVNNKTLEEGKPFTELYLDGNNVLQKRKWPNYQSFLTSNKNPDGSARSIDDVPLFTKISKPTSSVPYAFKQKYLFLQGIELPVATDKPPVRKDVKSTLGDFMLDGSVNKYTSKEYIDLGDYYEFTVELSDTGTIDIVTAETKHNEDLIQKINKNTALKAKMRQVLKDSKKYPEKTIDGLGDDIDFVDVALPTIVNIHIQKLKSEVIKSSQPSAPEAKEEAPPAPPTTPETEIDLNDINDDAPFRKVGVLGKEVERMTDAEMEYFQQFVKDKLPGIPYEYVENLVRVYGTDEEAWGVFEDGVAKVYKRAAKGTAFHEIMEGVWLGFLSPKEQEALLNEMRSKKGSFVDRASNRRIDYSEATNLELKERIMDDGADYFAGKIPAKSITGRILQFFKAIVDFFKHWIGKPSLKEQLFRDIERGKYKKYIFPEEKKKAAPQYKAIEGLSEKKANDFVQDMSARIFQEVFKNEQSLFDIGESIQKIDVFNSIKNRYRKAGVFNTISEETYDKLVSRTKEFLIKFGIEFDEENQINFNDTERTRNEYAASAFSVNFKKSSPYAVKLLISTLTKAERKTTPVGELLSMPSLDTKESSINGYTLVPYGKTWSTLINKLSNVRDVPTFINKLYELAKENPDYVRLYTRLGGDITSPLAKINFDKFKDHNWRLFVSFYQTFTKQKPDGFIQFVDGDSVYIGSANQASLVKQITNEWTENMKLLSDDEDSIIKLNSEKGVYYVDKSSEKWKGAKIGSPQEMIEFLSDLGIEFPIEAYNKIESSKLKKFAEAVGGIKTALNKSEVLMNVSSKELNMRGNIETLSSLYVSSTSPAEDSTFFNNKGERQQSFTESNYPSFFEYIINSVETLDELKEKFPQINDVFSTNSILLKKGGPLFDEQGVRRKNANIKVEYNLGDKNTVDNKGTSISELTLGKRTTLEINQNIRGSYYVIIGGDSSTEWMINLGNFFGFQEMITYDEEQQNKVNDVFQGYLRDEIALIGDAENRKKLKNVAGKAEELRFFKAILSEEMVEKVETLAQKKNLSKEEIDGFFETNGEKINEDIQKYITKVADKQKATLISENELVAIGREGKYKYKGLDKSVKQLGINKYNLSESDVNTLMRFLAINHITNTIEYHKILFGDPYQFKIKKEKGKVVIDQTKRIKSFLSPRRITVNFNLLNNWLNNELNTVDGIKLTNKDFGYHQHKDYAKTFTAKDVKIVGNLYKNHPAYENTDEPDASSWMNPGAYREVKWKNGQWSPQAEAFHQWEMAYARQKLSSKGKYKYPKDNRLYEHDVKLIASPRPVYVIEVMKPIATGNKFGKNYIDQVIDKTSQVSIYYSAVEGTNLENLFIKMFENGYDYVIVESGRKEGIEQSYDLYKGNGEFNDQPINNTIEVPWNAYGIQQENSYGEAKMQTRGSQLTKLSTVDLYDNGEAIGETPEREEVISNAVQRNNRALKNLIDNGYRSLLKKLTIEDLGSSFKVTDNVKVASLLRKELLKRDVSFNTLDAFEINKETGEFEIPFEASINYKQIKDLLYSIVDKKIASPKMNGFSAVQVSATGWENAKEGRKLVLRKEAADGTVTYENKTRAEYEALSDEEKKNIRFTSSALKFYEDEDGKRHCEILLPNWFSKQFRKRFNRDMTNEELSSFLNTEEGKKVMTGIGFRIPTQGLNSVEVFVVKGFLPEYMGRTVVVPSEITTKAGSDFDIDKLNLYLKNVYITPMGDILEVPFFGVGEKAMSDISDFILAEDLKEMANISEDVLDVEREEDDYESLTEKLYTESLENEYYNSLIELITLPENFDRLVTPNSTKELEEIADLISDLRNEKDNPNAMATLLDRSEMTKLRQIFVMAKKWVGIGAVNNTAHSLFQKTTMHVKFSSFRMSLNHNTAVVDNKDFISFSNRLDRAGQYISDTLSMFINSFVDVVKDPFIMKIIYSERIVGTFMMLARAGVPRKTMALFMNQPIIREYVKELDARGVSIFRIEDKRVKSLVAAKFPTTTSLINNARAFTANDDVLQNNISSFTENKMTPQQNAQQHLILEEFISYFQLGQDLFKTSLAINYDTTSFRNAEDLYTKSVLTEVAEDTNMICCPEKILNSSHLGTLRSNLDKSSSALGSILKFNTPEFRDILESVFDEYARNPYMKGDSRTKVAEKLTASFLDYIIQVKRPFDISDLVVNANAVAIRLDKMKAKHPEVTILKDLIVVSSSTPGGAKTVTLRVNTKEAYDEDLYVGYMREMRDNPATRDLYEDLVRLAIIQGNYFSSVSIKNIVPSEDYARIVAPIINTLKIDSDIMAFTKNKMFQRNLFKDNDVVGKGGPTFFITDNENEDEYDYLMGMDSDEVEIFQYRTKNFPVIAELHLGNNQRKMFTLKPRAIGANHSVIVIPRILSVGNEKIDFISSQTVTNAMYAERKAKGDRSIYDVFGYKRVEETDGTPFLTEDGYYVYKQINLLGDGQLATEHSVYPKRSVINNNTVKVKNEIPDEDIINYFTSKSMASAPRPDVVSFGTEVLPKVLSGEKTTTIRTVYESKAIGIPVGKTIKLNIGGKPFLITNRGIMNIDEAGGKAAMALSEALPTTPDATYKYPIDVDGVKHYAISTDTVGWFNGVGADRYVYDMQLVSPTEQTPTPTAPTQAPLSAKVEVEPNYYTSELLKANPNKIYVFGDNTQRKGTKGQAIIRGVKNAMGIATKFKPDTTEDSYFNDDTISENIGDIDSDIENIKTRLENNPTFTLVFPKDGLGTGLAKLKEKAPQTYAYLKQRLLEEFGFNNDTGEISKPFMAPVSEDVSKPVAGVENIPNSGLTIEQSNQFIDILQPQIVKQAYVENRARTANLMFSFGLRWARNIPNPTEKSEQAKNLGKPRPNKKQIKSKEGATYGYYTTDQNNNPIPSIKELQPIIDFIQSKLGIDMSNYDAMLGNIYDDSSFIHQHRDTTESITAKGYPVIVINLGADGHLEYDKDVSSTYASYKKSGQLNLTNGGIYAFGINGENRFTFHHRIGSGLESPNPLKPIKLPNGETLTNYRITLTFRRASDLEPEMPFTPNKITSTPVSTPVTQPSAPLTLETGRYVKYKEGTYIVTKMNDNGTYQIYNPTLEGASAKISVSAKNLSLLKDKANIVQYKEGEYIVTPKDTIISLTTNKIMKWGEENGDRKSILYLAKGARAFNSAFTEQRAAEILTNYSGKHSLTKEVALTTIADAINKEGQKAIDKLNECY